MDRASHPLGKYSQASQVIAASDVQVVLQALELDCLFLGDTVHVHAATVTQENIMLCSGKWLFPSDGVGGVWYSLRIDESLSCWNQDL